MNELVETNQQTGGFNQLRDSRGKTLSKGYSFFIFYNKNSSNENSLSSNIQKLTFKLRQEKMNSADKYLQNAKTQKQIYMFYSDIQSQNQLEQTFLDMKIQLNQNKVKVIVYGHQSNLIKLIDLAVIHGLDMNTIPFAIYSSSINGDLSSFLGWNDENIGNLSLKSTLDLSINAKKWISAPPEKIDMWSVDLKVTEKSGKISKLVYDPIRKVSQLLELQNEYFKKQYFFSSFCIGYHSRLSMDYESTKKGQDSSFLNKLRYGFEGFKKFCCVGKENLKSATGIVSVAFKDEKQNEIQIMKQFYQKNQNQKEPIKNSKYQHNQKILSIVMSNIELFQSQKLSECKMNDSKIQLITFESQNDYHKIASIQGQTRIKFQSQKEAFIQIGDSCYRLSQPLQAVIKPYKKFKVLINKQFLQC